MKELSIQEKAKAYDEAIKKVNDYYEGKTKLYSDIDKTLDYLFPELKESEDERIRRILIEHMEHWHECALENNVVQDIKDSADAITWLEKQGEQKYIYYSKQCADYKKDSELQMPRLTEFENELASILFEREYEGSTETEDDIIRGRLEYELAAIRLSPKLLSIAIKEQKEAKANESLKILE